MRRGRGGGAALVDLDDREDARRDPRGGDHVLARVAHGGVLLPGEARVAGDEQAAGRGDARDHGQRVLQAHGERDDERQALVLGQELGRRDAALGPGHRRQAQVLVVVLVRADDAARRHADVAYGGGECASETVGGRASADGGRDGRVRARRTRRGLGGRPPASGAALVDGRWFDSAASGHNPYSPLARLAAFRPVIL